MSEMKGKCTLQEAKELYRSCAALAKAFSPLFLYVNDPFLPSLLLMHYKVTVQSWCSNLTGYLAGIGEKCGIYKAKR